MIFKFCEGEHTLTEIRVSGVWPPMTGPTTRILFDKPVEVLSEQHIEWERDDDFNLTKAWLVDSDSGERLRELKFRTEVVE